MLKDKWWSKEPEKARAIFAESHKKSTHSDKKCKSLLITPPPPHYLPELLQPFPGNNSIPKNPGPTHTINLPHEIDSLMCVFSSENELVIGNMQLKIMSLHHILDYQYTISERFLPSVKTAGKMLGCIHRWNGDIISYHHERWFFLLHPLPTIYIPV